MNVPGPPSGRRSFLNWLLSTSVGAMFASVLYPVTRYVSPPDIPEAQTSRVTAGREGELKPNEGKIFRFGQQPGILVRSAEGEYTAYSATCTHLNCTVQYRPDLKQIWCACHNGFYDMSGRVVGGPPPRPLDEFQVNVADGEIVVSRS